MNIYDLSLKFRIDDMVFPGTPPMSYRLSHTVKKDFYNLGIAEVNSHAGTHTDAPRHFLDDGIALGDVSLEKYVGPCVVIDLRGKKANDRIGIEDVKAYENEIIAKKRVLLHTGWYKHANTETYYADYPSVDLELANYLSSLSILLIGVEAPSLNPPLYIEVHRAFLKKEIAIVESLANLDQILGKDVIFCAPPIAFHGADGFPVRAFAIEM
jgi:kynurenine formamidase